MFHYPQIFSYIDEETGAPEIISERNGGNVREGHTVFLSADTQDAEVFYTTDGTAPVAGDPNTKRYVPKEGVKLDHPGLLFVRAVALIKGTLPSKVLTSRYHAEIFSRSVISHNFSFEFVFWDLNFTLY